MAIIGVGINVLPLDVADAASGVAALVEIDPAASATRTLAIVAPALVAAVRRFESGGFAAFADRFAARDLLRGREIVGDANGGAVAGTASGVDGDGALWLDTASGRVRGDERGVAPAARPAGGITVLRVLLAALVVANLLFFAYTRGALDGVFGLRAAGDREPERLANQVRPRRSGCCPMTAAASAPPMSGPASRRRRSAPPMPTAVELVLASNLPAGAWTDTRGERTIGSRTEVTHSYRVANADAALAERLATLKLDLVGRGFSPCAKAADRPR